MPFKSSFINPEQWKQANVGAGQRMAQQAFKPAYDAANAASQQVGVAKNSYMPTGQQQAGQAHVGGSDVSAAVADAVGRLSSVQQRAPVHSSGGAALDRSLDGGAFAAEQQKAGTRATELQGQYGEANAYANQAEAEQRKVSDQYAAMAAKSRKEEEDRALLWEAQVAAHEEQKQKQAYARKDKEGDPNAVGAGLSLAFLGPLGGLLAGGFGGASQGQTDARNKAQTQARQRTVEAAQKYLAAGHTFQELPPWMQKELGGLDPNPDNTVNGNVVLNPKNY